MGPTTRLKLAKAASAQRQSEQEANEPQVDNTTMVGDVTGKPPRRSTRRAAKIDRIDPEIPIQRPTQKKLKTVEVRESLVPEEKIFQTDSQADMYVPTKITSPSRILSFTSDSLRSSSLSTAHSSFLEEDDDLYNPLEAAFFQEKQSWHTEREQLQAGILATKGEMASKTTDLLEKVSGLAADNDGLHRYLAAAQKQLTALSEELDQVKTQYQSESNALRKVLESEGQRSTRLKCDLHSLEAKLQSEYENFQTQYHQIQNEFPEKLQLCVQQEVERMRTAQGTAEMNTACQLRKENAEMTRQLAQATELLWHTQNRPSLRDETKPEPNHSLGDDRNNCRTTVPADKRPSSLAKVYLEASQVGNGKLQERSSRKKGPQKSGHGFRQPQYPELEAPEATFPGESKADTMPLYNFVNVNFGPESQVRFLGEPSETKMIQNKRSRRSHTPVKRGAVTKKDAHQTAKPLNNDRLESLVISLRQEGDLSKNAAGRKDVTVDESSDDAMDVSP